MIIIPQNYGANPTILISFDVNNTSKRILTNYSKETLNELVKIQNQLEDCETLEEQQALYAIVETLSNVPANHIQKITDDFVYDKKKNDYFVVTKEGYTIEVPVPYALVRALEEHQAMEKDYQYLIKFWLRLLGSPVANDSANGAKFLERTCQFVFKTSFDSAIKEQLMKEGYNADTAHLMSFVPVVKITRDGIVEMLRCLDPTNDIYEFTVNNEGVATRKLIDGLKYDCDKKTGRVFVSDAEGKEITTAQEYFESVDVYDWTFQPPVIGTGGDAFYCGTELGHEIRIGQVVRLPDWSYVNTNQNNGYSNGLHCGSVSFIQSYERLGNVTALCYVDPRHIGYCDGDRMCRVLQYLPFTLKNRTVHQRALYSASSYARYTDEQWSEFKTELIAKYNKEKETQVASVDSSIARLNNL